MVAHVIVNLQTPRHPVTILGTLLPFCYSKHCPSVIPSIALSASPSIDSFTMSAKDCPFIIIHPDLKDDEEKKDKYASFAIPLDPNNPDGPKSDTKFKKLNSNDSEDILSHIFGFNCLVCQLGNKEGPSIFHMKSHTGGIMTSGKGTVYSLLKKLYFSPSFPYIEP